MDVLFCRTDVVDELPRFASTFFLSIYGITPSVLEGYFNNWYSLFNVFLFISSRSTVVFCFLDDPRESEFKSGNFLIQLRVKCKAAALGAFIPTQVTPCYFLDDVQFPGSSHWSALKGFLPAHFLIFPVVYVCFGTSWKCLSLHCFQQPPGLCWLFFSPYYYCEWLLRLFFLYYWSSRLLCQFLPFLRRIYCPTIRVVITLL